MFASVEHVKRCVIGNGQMFPTDNWSGGDMRAACRWDCYRRATMLEPMVEAIVRDRVPGDFLEAGVFKGGIAIAMAAMMLAGDWEGSRTMWLADSFEGLPNVSTPVSPEIDPIVKRDNREAHFFRGQFNGSQAKVTMHLDKCLRDQHGELLRGRRRVRLLPGFFEDSLPGPVDALALLRVDGDLYTSITTTLERLWPLLSDGGFVVFDDWKFVQSKRAILDFRARWDISTPILFANGTLDPMAYWQKGHVFPRRVAAVGPLAARAAQTFQTRLQ
jgi:hypothetical protein